MARKQHGGERLLAPPVGRQRQRGGRHQADERGRLVALLPQLLVELDRRQHDDGDDQDHGERRAQGEQHEGHDGDGHTDADGEGQVAAADAPCWWCR